MKADNTLKGQALRTYNKVMNAMAEDNNASMLHTFAALTQQAKSIALQSCKFRNAYVRGELKVMSVEEAAKDLTARAAACVSCKVRNIDMIIATAFLAEYISRQRKEIETPKPTTPETSEAMNTNNTPATMNEATKSVNDIMNQANSLMAECNAKRNFKRNEAFHKIAFRYFDNIRACAGSFNSNDDSEYKKRYSRAQYMK